MNTPDWTAEQYAQVVAFIFSRRFGTSSEAMIREACGVPESDRFFSNRPWDKWDSRGTEETFALAPPFLQERMRPRLEWYREIAALGWPTTDPDRTAA